MYQFVICDKRFIDTMLSPTELKDCGGMYSICQSSRHTLGCYLSLSQNKITTNIETEEITLILLLRAVIVFSESDYNRVKPNCHRMDHSL